MSSLWEIDQRLLNYEMQFDEDGVWINEDEYESINMAKEEKIEGTCCVIKNKKAFLEALKNEKKALEERIRDEAHSIEALEGRIARSLGGEPFETTKCKVSFRKSESVDIPDEALVPDRFINITMERKPVKKNIMAYLKKAEANGEEVDWASINRKLNISIK